MAATIYDVAKKAGVGIGTVSRVINNSTQITSSTKEKVLKAIEALNYQPHAMARGLARKKTSMISIIVPTFTGYFYHDLFKGIQQELAYYQYDLILYNVDNYEKTDEYLRRTLQEKRVDGVLLISLGISDKYAARYIQEHFPIVLVDAFHPDLDSIFVENKNGAYLATEHLIQQGHRKVAMIDAQLKSSPAKERLEGYKSALEAHNISFNERYLVIANSVPDEDGFNREAGYQAMRQLLTLGENRPTAVFISSDIQAFGAIKAIKENHLEIPRDVAIVGFDDIELAEYLGLTTMRQPMGEIGKLGVQRLMKRIRGENSADFKKVFSAELIIRETCGAH